MLAEAGRSGERTSHLVEENEVEDEEGDEYENEEEEDNKEDEKMEEKEYKATISSRVSAVKNSSVEFSSSDSVI